MSRFKINRNINKEEKHLLQTKLDSSLIEDVNLLCKWSGNDKNYVVAELLRFALSQENDFQEYKQSLSKTTNTNGDLHKKDIGSEKRASQVLAIAK